MKEDDNNDHIREYLEGNLKGENLKKFESELKEHPELAKEVKNLREVELGLKSIGADKFKGEVKRWEREYLGSSNAKKGRLRSFRSYYPMAAAVLLLVTAAVYFYINRAPDYDTLYAENFTPYEDMILTRGENAADGNTILTGGMEAYNTQQYEVAVQKLTDYLSQNPGHVGVGLYIGIAQMELGNTLDAIKNLDLAQEDPMFAQQAQWYLGLLYLKNNQIDKARNQFNFISQKEGHYKKMDARELLKLIE